MQPFPVTCETCRARLKVRNASAIGEIHACPRCGSMVLIVPPDNWSAGGVDAAAAAPVEPAAATEAAAEVATPEAFADIAIPEPQSPPSGGAAELPVVDTTAAPSTSSAAPAAPPASALWSLVSNALARPTLMWSAAGGVLLLTTGLLTAVWFRGDVAGTEQHPQVAASAPVASELVDASPNHAAGDVEQATDKPTPKPPVAPPEQAESFPEQLPASDDIADSQLAVDPPALAELPPNEPASLDEAPIESSESATPDVAMAPAPAVSGSGGAEPAEPAEEDRPPVLKFDPLDFDPLALGLSPAGPLDGGATTTSVADDAGDADDLPPAAVEIEVPVESEPPPPAEEPTVTVERGPAEEAPRPQDVSKQLALPLAALDMPAISLNQFLATVSAMSGVPITVDPAALSMAGVSPRAEIAVRATNVTLEKLLRDTLTKQRLNFVEQDGQLVIVRPDIGQRRQVNYDVRDLVAAGAGDAASLARLLEHFVAPETWHAAGGDGAIEVDGTALRVDQTHGVHYHTLIFFERLRLARSLPTRSRYPAKLLSVEPPYGQLAHTLGQSTTFTFLPWTPLAEVVRHWEEATGLVILVDWQALAEVDLVPSSPVSCSAIDRTWEEALAAILEPLELAWLAVDGGTIQITTEAAAYEARSIEFYPVANSLREQFASDGALVEALGDELQRQAGGDDGLPSAHAHLEYDAPSGRVIALAGPAVHRYLTRRLGGGLVESETLTAKIRGREEAAPGSQALAQPVQ